MTLPPRLTPQLSETDADSTVTDSVSLVASLEGGLEQMITEDDVTTDAHPEPPVSWL